MTKRLTWGFAKTLQFWLDETGETRKWLANKIGAKSQSTITAWLNGESRPQPEYLVKLLNVFLMRLQLDMDDVLRAVDALADLEVSWQDVADVVAAASGSPHSIVDKAFMTWWLKGKPEPARRQLFIEPLLADYVERAIANEVTEAALGWAGAGRPKWRVIVLHGIPQVGKTTLAAGVAHDPRIAIAFREGVIWVNGRQAEMDSAAEAQSLCQGLGLAPKKTKKDGLSTWQEWRRQAHRRFLLIVDDVSQPERLESLLRGLGPRAVVLVTTRWAREVRPLEEWFGRPRILSLEVPGFQPLEGRAFIEQRLGRRLQQQEQEVVQEIGELVNWHPLTLRWEIDPTADVTVWRGNAALLRAGAPLCREVREVFQRYWERWGQESPVLRGHFEKLLGQMKENGRFGELYASVIWDLPREQARSRLHEIATTGLVERLQEEHDLLGIRGTQWRVAPLVFRTLHKQYGRRGHLLKDIWRFRGMWRRIQRYGGRVLVAPWQFQLLATIWMMLTVVKALVAGLLRLVELVVGRHGWYESWMDWSLILAGERHLRSHWEQTGIIPPEDFWLLYDVRQSFSMRLYLEVIIVFMALCGASLSVIGHSVSIWPAKLLHVLQWVIALAGLWHLTWRFWLAHLYGVETWDLKMMLWLARRLGMPELQRE